MRVTALTHSSQYQCNAGARDRLLGLGSRSDTSTRAYTPRHIVWGRQRLRVTLERLGRQRRGELRGERAVERSRCDQARAEPTGHAPTYRYRPRASGWARDGVTRQPRTAATSMAVTTDEVVEKRPAITAKAVIGLCVTPAKYAVAERTATRGSCAVSTCSLPRCHG